jgi:hypothetical protein
VGLCSCGHLSMKEPLKFSNDLTRKSLRAFGSLYLFGDMIRRNPPKTTGSVGRARVQAKVRLGKETGSHMQRFMCKMCTSTLRVLTCRNDWHGLKYVVRGFFLYVCSVV